MMARLRDQIDTVLAKPEGDSMPQTACASSSLTIGTTRRWSGFKNPRIVRVSRTFGGKDRHSKVCTIRGLRDRRIRLSVPTAIQLYDLQERLGLSQPSKVIDWLIDATKLDIDELPPLHFPQFHDQHYLMGQSSNNFAPPSHHFAPYLDANLTLMNGQPGQVGSSRMNTNDNLDFKINADGDGDADDDQNSLRASLERLKWSYNYDKASLVNEEDQYQGQGGSFVPGLMSSSTMAPYGSLYNWDPSSLSLSTQLTSHGLLGPTPEESSNKLISNEYHHQGESSSSNSTQQLFFCPPSMPPTTASLFPRNDTSAALHPRGSSFHVSNTTQQID